MGGPNSNQVIEHVHSYDPRSWSCLHAAEGGLSCNNIVIQNNDIGPCGSDVYQQWADGISVSCRSAVVRNNMVNNPTDGGIVLFGSPGTLVENNTIWVVNVSHDFNNPIFMGALSSDQNTLLGGINMVDVVPWGGNYTGTIVQNNTIIGGFATDSKSASQTDGENVDDVIIKSVVSQRARHFYLRTAQNWCSHRASDVVWRPLWCQRQLLRKSPEQSIHRRLWIRHCCYIGSKLHRSRECTLWEHFLYWFSRA